MTETQLRFLRALLERVPLERVAELYVFPPMRQGAIETGIAVVAAVLEEGEGARDDAAAPAAAAEDAPAFGVDAPALQCDPTEAASVETPAGDTTDAGVAMVADEAPDDAPPVTPEPIAEAPGRRRPTPHECLRHTVYTARYRLTLKGPERGRWEIHVVDEADAPLLSVEMVVRGVQRRTGDGAEPERLEPAALRALLSSAAESAA